MYMIHFVHIVQWLCWNMFACQSILLYNTRRLHYCERDNICIVIDCSPVITLYDWLILCMSCLCKIYVCTLFVNTTNTVQCCIYDNKANNCLCNILYDIWLIHFVHCFTHSYWWYTYLAQILKCLQTQYKECHML